MIKLCEKCEKRWMNNSECEEHCDNAIYYQRGRTDKESELKPLLNAIKFALEDYSIRLGDYAKVIDEKLKEQSNES